MVRLAVRDRLRLHFRFSLLVLGALLLGLQLFGCPPIVGMHERVFLLQSLGLIDHRIGHGDLKLPRLILGEADALGLVPERQPEPVAEFWDGRHRQDGDQRPMDGGSAPR